MPANYVATILGAQDEQTVQVTTGWYDGGFTPTSGRALELATSIATSWNSHFLPILCDDYSVLGCRVICPDNPTVEGFYSSAGDGSSTDQPLPAFVVANVKLTTGVRGRSYQGRFGIPGLSTGFLSDTNPNELRSTHQAILQDQVSAFVLTVQGEGIHAQLAVISTISGGAPRPTSVATPVTTIAVQPFFGSRISRKG